jgi:hypothetical protein
MTTATAPRQTRDTTKATERSILVRKRRMFERWAEEMRQFGIQVEIPAELQPPTEGK